MPKMHTEDIFQDSFIIVNKSNLIVPLMLFL